MKISKSFPTMKNIKNFLHLFLFTIFPFMSDIFCLQSGLRIQNFAKLDVELEDLASEAGIVTIEQERISSNAACATLCAETESCSGYLMCRDRLTPLCVFIQLQDSGQTLDTTSQYVSCFLYMPANFQLTKLSGDETTSTTLSTTSSTTTTTTTTTTTKNGLSANAKEDNGETSETITTYTPPSFCTSKALKPSTSNNCPYGLKPECKTYYKDCQESYNLHQHEDTAIYLIQPDGYPEPFKVLCSGGKGYNRSTHIQRNSFACCPSISFNQSWAAYRDGFGSLEHFNCSYWLGNKKLAALTRQRFYKFYLYKLNTLRWAGYRNFVVDEESSNFKMKYSTFAEKEEKHLDDGFKTVDTPNQDLNGKEFYTYDHDNVGRCASVHGSGWWFDENCARVNPNTDHYPQWYIDGVLNTFDEVFILLM